MGDNMTPEQWKELLNRLQLVKSMSDLSPLALSRLEEYEMRHALRLPQSYKDFCTVFGGGEIGGEVRIAVPSREGELTMFSLEKINSIAQGLEYEVYSPNPQQHKCAIFFAIDIARSYHFFDPNDLTHQERPEYGIYRLSSTYQVTRIADNFWDFITICCLGPKHSEVIGEDAPELVFRPVSV